MRKVLLSRDIIHCDETPVQVLKEEGKKPQTKSYMWLYRTGNDDKSDCPVYNIIETAKANRLNVYTYLEYLLLYMPDADWCNCLEELDNLKTGHTFLYVPP